ncbi:response regulator aspartate phosphatase RapK [Bacillus subtilis]|uniref:response regulator aspartate phosphatase RapK n=1 Tax=Bacillus subtilis TaxID=1423 RepID=UPI0010098794|nr:response regulator aspartate phosphatase RapK [Bacillus subtilis]MCS4324204.1 response regulator aspartate phosphatase RapK [Bacillus subtilis]NQE94972.1 response regulator aspartate phosphatase RapK [Bacillus subtilis]QAW16827.1 tetratricopeptide repeat protein [Bacillus subtilis]QAW20916.1 tetratricopeptide repeat protein [Bacillus subtilis]CAF1792915.1 Response regulator aspartate phosphatase G [Bacillus subtilis]
MSKIASEVVATTLNDWYIAIKKQKVDESIKYYSEIKKLFDEMEEDQEVLAYYSLLEERHKMLLHSSRGEPLQKHTYFTEDNQNFIKKTNDKLEYNFYLFEAMYEAYNKNYDRAINLYGLAEKKLAEIPDEIEAAEFYSKVSYLYTLVKQSIVAQHYIKNAISIYKRHPDYKCKLATSTMIAAANYADMKRFEEAEQYYLEAIDTAKETKDEFLKAQLFHNLSIVYSDWNKPDKCIESLEKAIGNESWLHSIYYINSLFMMIKELFKIDEKMKAINFYNKAQERLILMENKVYEAKISILYNLYCGELKNNFNNCISNIEFLKQQNELESVDELSYIAAKRFESIGAFEEATSFFNAKIWAEQKMNQVEGIL